MRLKTLLALGIVSSAINSPDIARSYYDAALRMADDANDLVSTGRAQAGLSESYARDGKWPEALNWLEKAYLSFRHAGLPDEEGPILRRLADIYGQQGDPAMAIDALLAALEVYAELDDSNGSATVAKELGAHYHFVGDERNAASYLEQGVAHARQIGDRKTELEALQMLRESYVNLGLPDEAEAIERRVKYLGDLHMPAGSSGDNS